MTATPIPRTVAMTVFGDLETSSLTELPKGRQPIASFVVPDGQARPGWQRMWALIGQQVAAGHQAYVVCPRIGDETEVTGAPVSRPSHASRRAAGRRGRRRGGRAIRRRPAQPAPATARLRPRYVAAKLREELPGLRIEILHGRLPAEQKDAVMTAFARGEIDVLVTTTVIEVGVDVANATVMAMLDADRFGISQLHQLRGRVGRGSAASHCLLHHPGVARLRRLRAGRKRGRDPGRPRSSPGSTWPHGVRATCSAPRSPAARRRLRLLRCSATRSSSWRRASRPPRSSSRTRASSGIRSSPRRSPTARRGPCRVPGEGMTRIVAGVAGGRVLAGAAGHRTRPTSDRAREALFSALASPIGLAGATFLDLYAGTGALGLEALSRGAAEVLLVENDPRAVSTLRDNVRRLGLPGATVRAEKVEAVLARAGRRAVRHRARRSAVFELDISGLLPALVEQRLGGGSCGGGACQRDAAPSWPAGLVRLPLAALRGSDALVRSRIVRRALCPGSFDPVTYGHLDIIGRASSSTTKSSSRC